jgi:hypothetical protein
VAVGRELVDDRLRQDDEVAGLAGQQLVAHRPDGAERAFHRKAAFRAEAIAQRSHQALRGTAAEQSNFLCHAIPP